MSSNDKASPGQTMAEAAGLADLLDVTDSPMESVEFDEAWSDPLESGNTDLDAIPTAATISFQNGVTRDTQREFLIKRAMVDPTAEVIPYEESEAREDRPS